MKIYLNANFCDELFINGSLVCIQGLTSEPFRIIQKGAICVCQVYCAFLLVHDDIYLYNHDILSVNYIHLSRAYVFYYWLQRTLNQPSQVQEFQQKKNYHQSYKQSKFK